jgi:hypothetical protein
MSSIRVDAQDRWLLDYFSWSLNPRKNTTYAAAYVKGSHKAGRVMHVYLHNCILGQPLHGLVIDHRNGDGLDCRRHNLRLVTKSQNALNTGLRCTNKTGHRNVRWHGQTGKYVVEFNYNGTYHYVGYFPTIPAAVLARDRAKERAHA